jgi:hypothetical protein
LCSFDFLDPFLYELNYIYNNLIIPSFSFDTYGFSFYIDDLNKDFEKIIKNLNGIKIINNKIDQRTLINLLQYYIILNNYYVCGDNIYLKIENTKISYRCIGTINEVLYEKFQENVISYFINNFKNYFNGFDFNYLMVNYFIKSKSMIESLKYITTNKIEPDLL